MVAESISNHRLTTAVHFDTLHQSPRPTDEISLIVLHCISLPAGHFGGHYIQDLFTGELITDVHRDLADLKGERVSAHLLIRRDGTVLQFVPFDQSAWHAGASEYQGRTQCNDFSLGIELEGTDQGLFASKQYEQLVEVVRALSATYSIPFERVVGHSDIAPGRKSDPGPGFDWQRFKAGL
ncbi:MAG: 1,6-anhydro-N-acetylmuramyl-L-alanine amidase AmpD [Pseudomonadales bacterium]